MSIGQNTQGYFANGMSIVSGAQLATAADASDGGVAVIPVDTNITGGASPQAAGILPGTLQLGDGQEALTALAGGGKAGATQLMYGLNQIDVCATAANSCLLPYAFPGAICVLSNDGAQSTTVFGKGTDTIDAVATATGNAMAAAKRATFYGLSGSGDGSDAGSWISIAGAKIS